MKLISLNVFGGHLYENLMDFIKSQAPTTDIFCFQEMQNTKQDFDFVSNGSHAGLFKEISKLLPEFWNHFALMQENFDHTTLVKDDINSGNATFVRKDFPVLKDGEFFIFGKLNSFIPNDYSTIGHKLHYVQFLINGKSLIVCNVHGTCSPADKLDSPERIEQSNKILNFLQGQPGEKIITGDFNLLPNTESVKMFEKNGFKNLIKQYKIQTTRGEIMHQLFPQYKDGPYGWQEFADYTFISDGIKPLKFEVPDIAVSDHLPLILEFDI